MNELFHILPTFQLTGDANSGTREAGYQISGTTAFIPLVGATTKYGGWESTSTIQVREAVRAAANDDAVTEVMLLIDSPGGQVAGNMELANDVATLATMKPTFAYASDMMASAALEVGVQAGRVFANESAMVGSIGTMSQMLDASKLAENIGIKVHPITSGGMKGAGMFGTPVTAEQIAYKQGLIDEINEKFIGAVSLGRNMSTDRVRQLADGRVHLAATAANLGLIDGVATLEQALDGLRSFSSSIRA